MLRVYKVTRDRRVGRTGYYRIKAINVLGETEFAFRVKGPPALFPSKTNTHRLLRDAKAQLSELEAEHVRDFRNG